MRVAPILAILLLVGPWAVVGPSPAVATHAPETSIVAPHGVLSTGAIRDAAAVWTGDRVLLFGGTNSTGEQVDDIVSYDPATQTATLLNATLPSPRAGMAAVWLDGRAYLFGGWFDSCGECHSYFDGVHSFDPATGLLDTLVPDSATPAPLVGVGVAAEGGAIYLFGGCDAWMSSCSNAVRKYDPATPTTAPVALRVSFPLPGRTGVAATGLGDGTVLVAGGEEPSWWDGDLFMEGSVRDDVHLFDPAGPSLTSVGTLPVPRTRATAFTVDGRAYLLGGGDGNGLLGEIVRLQPSVDATNLTTLLPVDRAATVWTGAYAYVLGGQRPLEDASPSATVTQVSPVPRLTSAAIDGGTLTLTYHRDLADQSVDPSAFTLNVRGVDFPFTSGTASGRNVVLQSAVGAPSGDDGFVTVTHAGGSAIVDAEGNDVLRATGFPVDVLTPAGRLPTPRVNPVAVWNGSDVLVIGGTFDASCTSCSTPSSILSYDPATGLAVTRARIELGCCATGALVDGAAYFTGGATSAVHRFDPVTGEVQQVADLPTRVRNAASATDGARYLYLFGGSSAGVCESECLVVCESCTPTPGAGYHDAILRIDTQAAEPVAEPFGTLPGVRSYAAAVVDPRVTEAFPAGRAFVIGGENGTSILQEIVEVDLATGAATNATGLRLPAPVYGASAVWVGDSFLVLGGASTDNVVVDTAYRVFPDRPEVLPLPVDLAVVLAEAGAAWDGTRALLLGGQRWTIETTERQLVPVAYTPDLAPPVATLDVASASGVNTLGWHTEPVTVTPGATDASALVTLGTRVDAAPDLSTGPVGMPDGASVFVAEARDAWGNVGTSAPVTVRQDTVAPTVAASGSEGTLSGPNASVQLLFSEPMDVPSTLAALTTPDGWTREWSNDSTRLYLNHSDVPVGTHDLALTTSATDAHGKPLTAGLTRNVTRPAPPPQVDTPPTTQPPPTTPPLAPRDLVALPTADGARLSWSAPSSDGGSAILNYVVRGGSAPVTVAGTTVDVPLAPGETRTFRVSAVNSNGEGSAAEVVARRAPDSTLALAPATPDGADGWYVTPPTVTLSATPADAAILVDVGAGETPYAGPFALPGGVTTLGWRAVVGDNAEAARETTLRVDAAPPVVAPTLSARDLAAGETLVLRALATDDASGVAAVLVELSHNGSVATFPLARNLGDDFAATIEPPAGDHAVAFVATDHAGRETRLDAGRLVVAAPAPLDAPPEESTTDDLEPTSNDDGTQGAPEDGEAAISFEQDDQAIVGVDAGARGIVTVRILGVRDPQDVVLVVIDENGQETVLDQQDGVAQWDTTGSGNGYYTVHARRVTPDGGSMVLASAEVLVRNPLRSFVAAATGFAAAALLAAGLTAAGPSLAGAIGGPLSNVKDFIRTRPDLFSFVQEVAVDAGQDKLRDKTKDRLVIEQRRRIRSVLAGAVAAILLAALWAVSEGGWNLQPWLAALPVVASAAFIVTVLKWSAEGGIAWVTHAAPRFRIWVTGVISLAVSVTFFHSPFGYPGFVEEVEREGAHRRRLEGVRALATIAGAAAFMLPFLALAALTPYAFVEIGLLIAITNVATSAMPFRPLPGSEVWAWSKPTTIALALAGFGLYAGFMSALTPMWLLWTLGIAGGIAQAAVMLNFRKTLGPAPRRVPVGVNVPIHHADAPAPRERPKQRN